ncbi:MAG: hypothetical protein GY859_33320 [Desulfobacterales bacterium]|nr:hypothetical protein [Desulfobacterales bacterium]
MIPRDPFLMRFVYFGFGEERRALELIDEQLVVYEKQLARRYTNMQRWEHGGVHVKLMADLGVRMNEVFLDWLENAREVLLKHGRSEDARSDPAPAGRGPRAAVQEVEDEF